MGCVCYCPTNWLSWLMNTGTLTEQWPVGKSQHPCIVELGLSHYSSVVLRKSPCPAALPDSSLGELGWYWSQKRVQGWNHWGWIEKADAKSWEEWRAQTLVSIKVNYYHHHYLPVIYHKMALGNTQALVQISEAEEVGAPVTFLWALVTWDSFQPRKLLALVLSWNFTL